MLVLIENEKYLLWSRTETNLKCEYELPETFKSSFECFFFHFGLLCFFLLIFFICIKTLYNSFEKRFSFPSGVKLIKRQMSSLPE